MPRRSKQKVNAAASLNLLQQRHHQHQQDEEQQQQKRQTLLKTNGQKTFPLLSSNNSRCSFLCMKDLPEPGMRLPPARPLCSKSQKSLTKASSRSNASKHSQVLVSAQKDVGCHPKNTSQIVRAFPLWEPPKAALKASVMRTLPDLVKKDKQKHYYDPRNETSVAQLENIGVSCQIKPQQLRQQSPHMHNLNEVKRQYTYQDGPETAKSSITHKSTGLYGTYLSVDGNRSVINAWPSVLEVKAPPNLNSNQTPAVKTETLLKPKKVITTPANKKIAPLRNLTDGGRDLWFTKADHATYNHLRCVRILPVHHQCAGTERYLTPNDVDIETLASKLESHRKLPKSGSKHAPCICFRETRRAYCTMCKNGIIGRAYRKCRQHPEVGFSTDHYYCPHCFAEASLLKDV